ncbi:MAG: hypothetical protein K2F85_05030 [Helicobacter sp.]|nr:hypothetical protein [Helicobacter sp.]
MEKFIDGVAVGAWRGVGREVAVEAVERFGCLAWLVAALARWARSQ